MHLNSCYFYNGEFNPLLVFMSDPCTQGLYQLRAVKGEPLEFCLYTQNPHPQCVHKCVVNTNTCRSIFAHSHATSHHTVPAAHNPKMIMATSHLLQQNHSCYTYCLTTLYPCFYSNLYHESTLGFGFCTTGSLLIELWASRWIT